MNFYLKMSDEYHSPCVGWILKHIHLPNYEHVLDDTYGGNVFGRNSTYDPAHMHYRFFHKNWCKAMTLSFLKEYEIKTQDHGFLGQVKDRADEYNIKKLALNQSLILLVTAMETFLRDNFIMILKTKEIKKLGNKDPEKIARKYSFQNLDSIKKAFGWLCQNFNEKEIMLTSHPEDFNKKIDMSPILVGILKSRHKIVHESYFMSELDKNLLSKYGFCILCFIDNFDLFFESEGYYKEENE